MIWTRKLEPETFVAVSFSVSIMILALMVSVQVIHTVITDSRCDEQARIEQKCVDESGHFERECP